MLQYEEHAPPEALASKVQCIWTLRGEGNPTHIDRILPDGSFELVFHRGDVFVEGGRPQPRTMLIGHLRQAVLVAQGACVDVTGMRVRPGGFHALTGLHAGELAGEVHDLRDAFGEDELEPLIAKLSKRPGEADARVDAAVAVIMRRNGQLRIARLAAALNVSERTLERLFRQHVGLSPKELARVARFQAEISGSTGAYFDDSHRNREFREIAGATPAVVFAERTELADAFLPAR